MKIKHLGREYVKVICDVCGGQFHQKDTVLVTNKYNTQYGLVVCKADVDQINEQILPNNHIDRPISSPQLLRPERADQYVENTSDDRVPGPPRNPFTQVNPINDTIDLYWQGPEDNGSSGITGYIIKRADPQLSYYDTVEDDTSSNATYYQDTSADVATCYSYKIAAINSFGTGVYSTEFFWPVNTLVNENVSYLFITPANKTLTIDSDPLIIS